MKVSTYAPSANTCGGKGPKIPVIRANIDATESFCNRTYPWKKTRGKKMKERKRRRMNERKKERKKHRSQAG